MKIGDSAFFVIRDATLKASAYCWHRFVIGHVAWHGSYGVISTASHGIISTASHYLYDDDERLPAPRCGPSLLLTPSGIDCT